MSSGFLSHPDTVLAEWMCPELLSSAILKVPSILQPVLVLLHLRKLFWTGKPDFTANWLCLFQTLSRARVFCSCISWVELPELLAGVFRSWAPLGHNFLGASTHAYPSFSLHFAFLESRNTWVWSPALLSKGVSTRAGSSGPCLVCFWVSPRMDTPGSPQATCSSVWQPPQQNSCFLMFKGNLLYFSLCPLRFILSLGNTEKSLGTLSYFCPSNVYEHWWDPWWAFSIQG